MFGLTSSNFAAPFRLFAPMVDHSPFSMQQSSLRSSTVYPDSRTCRSGFRNDASVRRLALLLMNQRASMTPKIRSIESLLMDIVEQNSTTKDFSFSELDTYTGQTDPIIRQSLKRPLSPVSVDASHSTVSTLSEYRVPHMTSTSPSTAGSCVSPCCSKSETNGGSTKTNDAKWLSILEDLKAYKREHGDCIVPRGYAQNPRLASWVAEQRKQFKLMKDSKPSSITPERIMMLDNLGFAWNAQEAAWEKHMSDLKLFCAEHGHCHVPLNNDRYPKLGLWVKEQRRHYTLMKQGKQSHMTHTRVRELDKIGFCWDTHEATWLERLRELIDFKEQHGSCAVPTNYDKNPKLGTWVHHQRRQYKKFKEGLRCHITQDRVRALENVGFVWEPRNKSPPPYVSDSSSTCSSVSGSDQDDFDFRPSKRQRSL